MLGRNTEMNLLQMNKQKKCLRNSVYFPGLLDRGVVQKPWRFL